MGRTSQPGATFPVQSATETSTTAPSPCGTIPSIAQAYSLNLTLVPHPLGTPVNFVTMWPDNGSAIPSVSTLNDQQGAIVSNAAIVPAGTTAGGINVYAYGPTDIILDMNGFYAAPTDLNNNTAIGTGALLSNTCGGQNTAVGQSALSADTTGNYNTAVGLDALQQNTNGSANTASGTFALGINTTGSGNTAIGDGALSRNATGGGNTAIGAASLQNNTGGSNNIALGSAAAISVPAGSSNNIHIGSLGVVTDDHVIRIGAQGTQTVTAIAGIYGGSPNTPNLLVCIDGNGTLGTTGCTNTPSSQRFKEQTADMGDSSSKMLQLRPVTFLYKPEYDDGSHSLQYGLIAEEVAKLYPEMVGYDKDGQPNSVKYQSLAPMLLNEVQKQNAQIQGQSTHIQSLEETVQLQHEENRKLEKRLAALEALLSGGTAVAKSGGSQ